MTSITLPRSRSNQGLAYYKVGEGTPIVFIHGVGLRSECWYQQIEALKNNYAIYAVDMPGHGESDLLDQANPTLQDFTVKLAEFIKDVVKTPTVIIGHSMGGLLSLSLASQHPEICMAVVAMNTVFKRSAEAKSAVLERANNLTQLTQADACAPISRWFSETPSLLDQAHAKLCEDWLLSANLEGYAAAYRVFATEDGLPSDEFNHLKMPILYLTGDLDQNSNSNMTTTMASITANAESLIVKNSRHMTPLTHAVEVNQAVTDFLQRRLQAEHV